MDQAWIVPPSRSPFCPQHIAPTDQTVNVQLTVDELFSFGYVTVMANEAFDRAVAAVGSISELARRLGVSKQAISMWGVRDIPIERVADVERITGIPRAELRPDIFGAT